MEACQLDWIAIAAWVQAIGSILALGIAIWVPFKLDKESRKRKDADDTSRARVIHASFLPNLYKLRASTKEFLELESGEPSFLGLERNYEDFDSDFFSLVPEFKNVLNIARESGALQEPLIELSVALFQTNELLDENTRLQRDGYHSAWINHKDIFIEEAQRISILANIAIEKIEDMYDSNY